ncbi:transposase [Paracoccus nototheniae]|uniref:Transposase n=1 Tax=Paracoccus nototheniae TaxID=2489002 RepID=A0ABW4DWV9_9RHOB|nr:transposase [Paracoccus nototheniae]
MIGLDIAGNIFQIHGMDGQGRAVLRRKVQRDRPLGLFGGLDRCLIGMEACATAYHRARRLQALDHEVPADVTAYVKPNKTDAADAEAICKAVTRPRTRLVPVKSADAQSVLTLPVPAICRFDSRPRK